MSSLNLYPKPKINSTEFQLNGLKLSNEFRDIMIRLGLMKPGAFDHHKNIEAFFMAGGKL